MNSENISIGNGMYKSTDAGRTWTHMGLDATGRIGRIVIDPANPDIVLVAAQGHSYGPQPERGVFRTTDGGRTWQKTLFVNENTGAIDVVMHPRDSKTLFAAAWQLELHTYGRESGGTAHAASRRALSSASRTAAAVTPRAVRASPMGSGRRAIPA